jgi:nucleoside-diphosphate-sugar epimerase
VKILLPGGAGLVGQNLVARLKLAGNHEIVVLDKHRNNLKILKSLHPDIVAIEADLSQSGNWEYEFRSADVLVMLQAQIGGLYYGDFERNNITSTELILDLIKKYKIPKLIHISSSVVVSVANDFYSISKRLQEDLVLNSGIPCPIFRPTLMYGWFDRKHLGWLAKFMRKSPIFPIPGDGRFMRQPLYAGDFCDIIISSIHKPNINGIFNISGHEKIDYIDMIRMLKKVLHSKTWIVKIPYGLFHRLLTVWAFFDKNPPFTAQQLEALVGKDEFEMIDWPSIFGVSFTPLAVALKEVHGDPRYSSIVLEF